MDFTMEVVFRAYGAGCSGVGAPPLRDESRVESGVVERVKAMVRNFMPLPSLFNPALKIDLSVFFKDQQLFFSLAELLRPFFGKRDLTLEEVQAVLEGDEILAGLKKEYFPALCESCFTVLSGRPHEEKLVSAIDGRIFTLKNALIGQVEPELIRASQVKQRVRVQSIEQIRSAGKAFIEKILYLYLVPPAIDSADPEFFKSSLQEVAEKLFPFVQNITQIYLESHRIEMPDRGLSGRYLTGYNFHGRTAAIIMEVCLKVLGYEAQSLVRYDLEPKVTLATVHTIVRVLGLDGKTYVVDPCYVQFLRDACNREEVRPVLVLEKGDIEGYIEKNLMRAWRSSRELTLSHTLPLKGDLILDGMDRVEWVRNSFKRVWDLSGYHPDLSKITFNQVFFGEGLAKTVLSHMQMPKIIGNKSVDEVKAELEELLAIPEMRQKNSERALRLLAQISKQERCAFYDLLDLDPRVSDSTELSLNPDLNVYFRQLKKDINPDSRPLKLIYGCAGADATAPFLATDADEAIFVDLADFDFTQFKMALAKLHEKGGFAEVVKVLKTNLNFFSHRRTFGASTSLFSGREHIMDYFALKLLCDLKLMGVDLETVELSALPARGVQIKFDWQYFGQPCAKERVITLLHADITKPESYPRLLQEELKKGFDLFFLKGAFFVPRSYPLFLPHLARAINPGGFFMTTDKTFTMDLIDPEPCLLKAGFRSISRKSDIAKTIEPLLERECSPIELIPYLEMFPSEKRAGRNTGCDISYWSVLNIRQIVRR